MIKVLFFAALREQIDCESMMLPHENIKNVQHVLEALITHQPAWKKAFSQSLLCAVNQEMVDINHCVNEGDDIAFFPPVTGG